MEYLSHLQILKEIFKEEVTVEQVAALLHKNQHLFRNPSPSYAIFVEGNMELLPLTFI